MTPSSVLSDLLEQHDTLRRLMLRCERLADALDAGADVATDLAVAVKQLRVVFDAHNRLEEAILRPVLLEADAFGPVRIERMVDEHVREHRAVGVRLANLSAGALRDVIATLRQHLEEEERYFLSSRVLRDDIVTVESSS
jgi:hypothetical protein